MIEKNKFDSFFKLHSENVDNASNQGFWRLSDEIVKSFLLEIIEKREGVVVVDFGGGTGKWAKILDDFLSDSKIVIVDISKDMLSVAKRKIEAGLYKNEIEVIESDIAKIDRLGSDVADYIISTYNPLSFVESPQLVIDEAYRILKPTGKAAITAQAYYNALFSKIYNYQASAEEIESIYRRKKLFWNDFVPETWQLSKQDLESMFDKSGFKNITSRGIACVTQPQEEDWDQTNKKIGALSSKLDSDTAFFEEVLKTELLVGKNQYAVNRGMNIMTIGEK